MYRRRDSAAHVFAAILAAGIGLFTGCATTLKCSIQSNPPDALILQHNTECLDSTSFAECKGITPSNTTISFFLGQKKSFITVEKRGYRERTMEVTKTSDTVLSFQLERIDSVPETLFDRTKLQTAKFLLLPVTAEIHYLKGVGSFSNIEYQPEESYKKSVMLQAYVKQVFDNTHKAVSLVAAMADSIKAAYTKNIADGLKGYMRDLEPKRLAYYSYPPQVSGRIGEFSPFAAAIRSLPQMDSVYFLYVWSKSVSETGGRVLANAGVNILGAISSALSGTASPTISNTEPVTDLTVAVIDPHSLEVVSLEKRRFSLELNKDESVEKLARTMQNFPAIDTLLCK
jgi:hypothetical protein